MGIIAKLKEIFNKNIDCDNQIDNHIVFLHKKKYIYLNKNIIVNDKAACVIVYKHRVCDVLYVGKYKINEESIPETFSRAKIEKKLKNGAKSGKIRVDIYYVNLSEFKNFSFESDEPFKLKSTEIGRVGGYLQGLCTLKIFDPKAIVKSLIFETGKEKNNQVNNDISLWVGNRINKSVEKNKIPAQMLFNNLTYVESLVNTEMQNGLDKLGLFVSNVKLKAINFPKKYQIKVNKYLSSNKKSVKPTINASFANVNGEKNKTNSFVIRGASLDSKSTMCSRCGARVPAGSIYCGKCGRRL